MHVEFLFYAALLLLLLAAAGLVSDGHVARMTYRLARLVVAGLWLIARKVKDLASAMYNSDGLTARGMRVVNALDTLALNLWLACEHLDRAAWRINPDKEVSI